MKRKTIFLIVIMLMMTVSIAFAAEELLSFTAESAKEAAVTNDKQGEIDDYDIKSKESALDDAKDDAKKGFAGGSYDDMYNRKLTVSVAPLEAETAIEVAKRQKEENVKALKLQVYTAIQKILLIKKDIEIEEKKLDILAEKQKIGKTKFDEGVLAAVDLYDAEYNYDTKVIELTSKKNALNIEIVTLKSLMNLPLDETPIEITGSLKEKIFPYHMVIDEKLPQALKNDINLYKKEQDLVAKEMSFGFAQEVYKEYHTKYLEVKTELLSAQYAYEDAKASAEVKVRNLFNDIQTKGESLKLAKRYEKLIDDQLKAIELKYNSGMVTNEDVLGVKEKQLAAQYDTFSAIYDLNILIEEFNKLIIE